MSFHMIGLHHRGRPPHQIIGFSEPKFEKNLAQQEICLVGVDRALNSDQGRNVGNLFRSEPSGFRKQASGSWRKPSVSNKANMGSNTQCRKIFSGGNERLLKDHTKVNIASNTQNGKKIGKERLFRDPKMDQPSPPISSGASNARIKQGEDFPEKNQLENSDGENWRTLSRTLSLKQKFSSISNSELLRLAELRFSNDMQEGDSGNQVSLLQKALFWLGYLSTESDITGCFGTATKQALCEFQNEHGIHQTAIWNTPSKQALWHTVSGEILHRVADEKKIKKIVSNTNRRVQACQLWWPTKFAETFEAVVLQDEWRLLSGIALLVTGILFGLFVSRYAQNCSLSDKSTKRRIIRPSAKQNVTLPPQQDLTSSSTLNGATVAMEKPIQTGSPNMSVENMDSVTQVNDAHAVVDKVIWDPLTQSKTIPTSHNFKRIRREALGLSATEITKSVLQASLKRPTTSKTAFESSYNGRQRESRVRPAQNSEESNGKTSSVGTQGSIRYQKQNDLFDNFSMTASSIKDVSSTSHRDKMEVHSKHPVFSFATDGRTKALNREDEPNIKRRIEELRKAVEAAEQNGQDAVNALQQERKRSMELEEKISEQRECAAALEEEVRVLKESHDVLLESVRKKL